MIVWLRCFFLVGLLFADLADDICAALVPLPQPETTLTASGDVVLLSLVYRRQCLAEIEQPRTQWEPLATEAVSCLAAALPPAPLPNPLSASDPLTGLMSFQC